MYKCIECGSPRGKNKTGRKGDRCIKCHKIMLLERSRNGSGRYVKISGTSEHRLVASIKIGRPLRGNEVVHHKNGDKKDNRPENLEVMDHREHMRIHATKHTGCHREGCINRHYSLGLCLSHYLKLTRFIKKRGIMSDIITKYLMTSMTRTHNGDTRAIDKEIAKWQKLVKYKTRHDEAMVIQRQVEQMIQNLIGV